MVGLRTGVRWTRMTYRKTEAASGLVGEGRILQGGALLGDIFLLRFLT